jgi:hypothetical protein
MPLLALLVSLLSLALALAWPGKDLVGLQNDGQDQRAGWQDRRRRS